MTGLAIGLVRRTVAVVVFRIVKTVASAKK